MFGTTLLSLMMDQGDPKRVAVGVLKHYCYSDELRALVGLHCGN